MVVFSHRTGASEGQIASLARAILRLITGEVRRDAQPVFFLFGRVYPAIDGEPFAPIDLLSTVLVRQLPFERMRLIFCRLDGIISYFHGVSRTVIIVTINDDLAVVIDHALVSGLWWCLVPGDLRMDRFW
mgnify:CR=1 FL=1